MIPILNINENKNIKTKALKTEDTIEKLAKTKLNSNKKKMLNTKDVSPEKHVVKQQSSISKRKSSGSNPHVILRKTNKEKIKPPSFIYKKVLTSASTNETITTKSLPSQKISYIEKENASTKSSPTSSLIKNAISNKQSLHPDSIATKGSNKQILQDRITKQPKKSKQRSQQSRKDVRHVPKNNTIDLTNVKMSQAETLSKLSSITNSTTLSNLTHKQVKKSISPVINDGQQENPQSPIKLKRRSSDTMCSHASNTERRKRTLSPFPTAKTSINFKNSDLEARSQNCKSPVIDAMCKRCPNQGEVNIKSKKPNSKRTHSDITPQRLIVDCTPTLQNNDNVECPKPSSAPESRNGISNRLQKFNSTKSRYRSIRSLSASQITLESPKWKLRKMSSSATNRAEAHLHALKQIVETAKSQHKTFTCRGGYRSIRNALEARGWIERINIYQGGNDELTRHLYKLSVHELLHGVHDKNTGIAHRRVILSKLMGAHQVDLYWDYSRDVYRSNPEAFKQTMMNTIQRGVFSYATKHGLCQSSKDAHWFHKPGISHLRHPRSYSINGQENPEEFTKDFRITACMSFLKWIVEAPRLKCSKLTSEEGKIDIEQFQFAVRECMKFLRRLKHEDIDTTIPDASEKNWTKFLDAYSEAVHKGNHFKSNIFETECTLIHKSEVMLERIRKHWPYCNMDGMMNIWILKPSQGSRGIGIHICRTLSYVFKVLNEHKNSNYVIQKYIERPLLIFNTKFDIRQWFLISSTCPLTIWIYKQCYFRFSSQTYNLRKLHESIHLTNNSVQSRYHSTENRDPSIPHYNMWDLARFQKHLVQIGSGGAFERTIYPGMKESITAAILLNQDHLNKRANSFELHGADFMLTEDLKPWLIEINSRPALYSSTPVTAKLCPQVLTDTIKVVIDNRENISAPTGLFELLYKEKLERLPAIALDTLQITGHAVNKEYFQTPAQAIAEGKICNPKKSSEIIDITNNKNFIIQVGKEMRNTLEQLLSLIQKEKTRRRLLRKQLNGATNKRKEELKELYKKNDFSEIEKTEDDQNSIELQNVMYKTLSNQVLNNITKDAKQLHGMLSKELGISTAKEIVEILPRKPKTSSVDSVDNSELNYLPNKGRLQNSSSEKMQVISLINKTHSGISNKLIDAKERINKLSEELARTCYISQNNSNTSLISNQHDNEELSNMMETSTIETSTNIRQLCDTQTLDLNKFLLGDTNSNTSEMEINQKKSSNDGSQSYHEVECTELDQCDKGNLNSNSSILQNIVALLARMKFN